jgi:hypothetical protein
LAERCSSRIVIIHLPRSIAELCKFRYSATGNHFEDDLFNYGVIKTKTRNSLDKGGITNKVDNSKSTNDTLNYEYDNSYYNNDNNKELKVKAFSSPPKRVLNPYIISENSLPKEMKTIFAPLISSLNKTYFDFSLEIPFSSVSRSAFSRFYSTILSDDKYKFIPRDNNNVIGIYGNKNHKYYCNNFFLSSPSIIQMSFIRNPPLFQINPPSSLVSSSSQEFISNSSLFLSLLLSDGIIRIIYLPLKMILYRLEIPFFIY